MRTSILLKGSAIYPNVQYQLFMETRGIYTSDLLDLAEGPYEEPFCCACSTLVPIEQGRGHGCFPAHRILNWHDEPKGTEFGEHDYVYNIGLEGVMVYQRCLMIYKAARATLIFRSLHDRIR